MAVFLTWSDPHTPSLAFLGLIIVFFVYSWCLIRSWILLGSPQTRGSMSEMRSCYLLTGGRLSSSAASRSAYVGDYGEDWGAGKYYASPRKKARFTSRSTQEKMLTLLDTHQLEVNVTSQKGFFFTTSLLIRLDMKY